MTISSHQFEFIMGLVIEWANDLPFKTWFELLTKTHVVRTGIAYNLRECDAAPDYQITLVNGEPYLYDILLGGKGPGWNVSGNSTWSTERGRSLYESPEEEPREHVLDDFGRSIWMMVRACRIVDEREY